MIFIIYIDKNTIRNEDSAALYTVYTVYTVDTVNMVYTVDAVDAVDTDDTVATVEMSCSNFPMGKTS